MLTGQPWFTDGLEGEETALVSIACPSPELVANAIT